MSAFEHLPLRRKVIAGGIVLMPILGWSLFLLLWVPQGAGSHHCPRDSQRRAEMRGERIVFGGWPVGYRFGYLPALLIGMGAGHLYARRRSGR